LDLYQNVTEFVSRLGLSYSVIMNKNIH